MQHPARHLPLGKTNEHAFSYTPPLLFPISHTAKWAELGLSAEILPCHGVDIWNYYGLSWLTPTGEPVVAIDEFLIPADSPNIIEPESFKLYLNSLNRSAFDSREALRTASEKDLSSTAGAPVGVRLHSLDEVAGEGIKCLPGCYIDGLDVAVDGHEQPCLELLCYDAGRIVEEQFYSHLLRPNCPATGQSNWGTLVVDYQGPALDPTSLLTYLVPFRQRQDFHEQCVKHIFLDLQHLLQPQTLSVYVRCVRRGGLDINLYRSLAEVTPDNRRLVR